MYPIEIRNNIPYVGELSKVLYIVAHETANPKATLMEEVQYMERNWQNAFVTHFVGDGGKIVQVSPSGKLSYGAGGKANPFSYAQVELCRNQHHPETFKKNYAAYIWLLKKLRKEAQLPNQVDQGAGIVTHYYISHHLGGTNHEDPYSFLRQMGISKEQFIKDLTEDAGWKKEGAFWYYEKDGQYQKGWLLLDNLWYYFHPDGKMATGWQLIKGTWYFLEKSGAMKKGWYLYQDHWYYLDEKTGGMIHSGIKTIHNKQYYFETNGKMREKAGFHPLTWFALKENGEVITGWYKVKQLWYFLGKDGVMVTGWVFHEGHWYYLKEDGVMLSNCQKYLQNKLYTFDLSGKCLNP